MLHHILSTLGLIEDKSVKLYQSILKGNEKRVDEILSLFFRPEYTDMREGDDILAFSACFHPNIANRLFHAYDRQISYREKGRAFRKAALSGSVQGVTVLLKHCAKEMSPTRAICWVVEKNCIEVIGAVIGGFLEHYGKTILPEINEACRNIEKKGESGLKFCDIISDALCHAAAEGQCSAVKILLEIYGEEISPDEKRIARRNATREDHAEIVALLQSDDLSKQNKLVRFGESQVRNYCKTDEPMKMKSV